MCVHACGYLYQATKCIHLDVHFEFSFYCGNDFCHNILISDCRELAPGTVSLTDDCVHGDDSKQNAYYKSPVLHEDLFL